MSPTPHFFSLRSPSANSRKLYLYRPLSIYLTRANVFSNRLEISAHFSRPTNRRNYLRKKLTQHRQFHQVRPLQIPVHEFCENDDCKLNNVDSSVEQSGNIEEKSSLDNCSASGDVEEPESKLVKKTIGGPILLNELEGWVEQYKKDSEFWGIGTGHIFTVFQDSEGKVESVVVNEDEIMRRSGVDPSLREDGEAGDLAVVNYKISFAKDLAKEMVNGSNIIMKDSSVAKFVLTRRKSGVTEAIRGVMLKPSLLTRMSSAGIIVLCGFFVIWSIKGLFGVGEDSEKHTMLEKGMSRRKMEAREGKEKMMKGSVEVIQDPTEPKSMPFKRPRLDKEELLNSIIRSKESNHESTVAEYSRYQSKDFEDDIQQIRAMARHAREIEKGDSIPDTDDDENDPTVNALSAGSMNLLKNDTVPVYKSYETIESNGTKSGRVNDMNLLTDDPDHQSDQLQGTSSRTKLRIIKSVREAREYLSRKHCKLEINREPEASSDLDSALTMPIVDNSSCNTIQASVNSTDEAFECSSSMTGHDYLHHYEDYKGIETVDRNADSLNGFQKSRTSSGHEVGVNNQVAEVSIDPMGRERESNHKNSQTDDCENETPPSLNSTSHSTTAEVGCGGSMPTKEVFTQVIPGTTFGGKEDGKTTELTQSAVEGNWIEKNFHELEPFVKKIAVGFRDNYVGARERSNNGLNVGTDLAQLKTNGDEQEFEWMKDERLREIVFKVRDNELSGRDPFHLVDDEDKYAFFSGLEKKVELENEKLMKVHEYFHENIENLDYGADGISLYDPPEKIIPRWKVSPAEKNPEFLNNFVEQRKALVAESLKNSFLTKNTGKDSIHKPKEPSSFDNNQSSRLQNKIAASSKTVITGSDGSVKAGKKSGREYWQHTKKWSEGFLESFNAETDPEVKAVMKDIGKDLDRWITEKEIKEAADFMDKLPEKGQKLIKHKLEKVKREMELFGPQAVVSKYREFAEEKEEDYLWWLDLPFVLCLELYTMDNGEQKVGFYSLEMGAVLELDPKQYHVIAFEDVGDCKNLCYIIQAHMEMLGNGNAFVVSRQPKDAFREAKANGFGVTVVRKGQLQLNIDQTLEEVEEMIVEIGSKIYHDKIMKDRAVDIKALMKGVFGISHPAKRKKKRQVKP